MNSIQRTSEAKTPLELEIKASVKRACQDTNFIVHEVATGLSSEGDVLFCISYFDAYGYLHGSTWNAGCGQYSAEDVYDWIAAWSRSLSPYDRGGVLADT